MYDKSKILFLIVGTGNPNDPEGYKRLLRKAIDETGAGNVVLISSGESAKTAEEIKNNYVDKVRAYVAGLPEQGMEVDNVDKCYKFLDELFNDVIHKNGFTPEDIVVDFTHGTKVMSAALYAVGMRHNVSNFHYIKRNNDEKGNLIAGETIQKTDAAYARELEILKQCRILFKTWQFSAAKSLLSIKKPENDEQKELFSNIEKLADFYSEWDRMDYAAAERVALDINLPAFGFSATSAVRKWVKGLTFSFYEYDPKTCTMPTKEQLVQNAKTAINMMFDLYANGLRRLESGLFEDASIRAYRMAEMLGQIYMLLSGYKNDELSDSDANVRDFAQKNGLRRQEGNDFLPPIGRKKVIDFLRRIGKQKYADILKNAEELVEKRNNSILIHGFSACAKNESDIKEAFDFLLNQLKPLTGGEEWTAKLHTAMFMNNFKDNA